MTEETRIMDRCPSCGNTTLFVGMGGYLACSFLGCPEPGVGRAIERIKRERDEARKALAWFWRHSYCASPIPLEIEELAARAAGEKGK